MVPTVYNVLYEVFVNAILCIYSSGMGDTVVVTVLCK